MNKYALFLIAFLFSSLVWSQAISSAELSLTKINEEDELISVASIRFDVKNHGWSVGPVLLVSYGDQVEERETIKLTGLQLGYEHFPHGRDAKWNMFHSIDLITQRIQDKQQSQYFDLSDNQFKQNQITQRDVDLLIASNVGVLLNLNEKLSTNAMIGLGFRSVFRDTHSDLEEFQDVFLSQIWVLKFGIRYQLGKSN